MCFVRRAAAGLGGLVALFLVRPSPVYALGEVHTLTIPRPGAGRRSYAVLPCLVDMPAPPAVPERFEVWLCVERLARSLRYAPHYATLAEEAHQ